VNEPELLVATEPADLEAVYAVRYEVFVEEQAVPIEIERDAEDASAVHLLARVDGVAIGAGRLVARPDGVGILGRLAVVRDRRGGGLGVRLVRRLEAEARSRGLHTAELHAQTHALAFYERLGYQAFGEEYEEAGIPHVSMRAALRHGAVSAGG
jgi:predicted GNAT family N-acyltransferase